MAAAAPADALVAGEVVEGKATIEAIDPARQTVTVRNDAGAARAVRVAADVMKKA